MNNARQSLRVNVGFLVNQEVGTSRDIHFEHDLITLSDDLTLEDFKGVVRISKTANGLLVQGDFGANIQMECVRCLEEFRYPIRAQFDELYAFNRRHVTESDLVVPENGFIELESILREYLLIEMPIRPLCKEDCKGLCVVCGADLNHEDCGHKQGVSED